jgi:hypothetical protein
MTKSFGRIKGVALCGFAAAYYASNAPGLGHAWGATPDASGYTQDYSDATLAKVIPGQSTTAQLEALLGQPWRTTDYGEPGEDEPGHEPPLVWEWRGRDIENGPYRVHVEFTQGIVTNIAKVPDSTGVAPARVAPAGMPDGTHAQVNPRQTMRAQPNTANIILAQATADSTTTAQVGQASGSIPDASGYNHDYSDATLAKVIPGQTTKAQIENLLGQPWRTTNYAVSEDEPGSDAPEVWEWRGRDSPDNLYRVHIEFNQHGTVTNVAKVPEKTAAAPARSVPDAPAKGPNATPQVTDDPSAGMFRRQMPPQPTQNGGD